MGMTWQFLESFNEKLRSFKIMENRQRGFRVNQSSSCYEEVTITKEKLIETKEGKHVFYRFYLKK